MINKQCLVLLFGSIYQQLTFVQMATSFTYFLLLKILLFNSVQM